jgi:hypothetical protein
MVALPSATARSSGLQNHRSDYQQWQVWEEWRTIIPYQGTIVSLEHALQVGHFSSGNSSTKVIARSDTRGIRTGSKELFTNCRGASHNWVMESPGFSFLIIGEVQLQARHIKLL